MRRRAFLAAAASGVGLASCPLWLRRAFGDSSVKVPGGAAAFELAAARGRGLRSGKPLLIIVIPESEGEKDVRGRLLGALLNYGSDEQLAPLALVDVVCASLTELRQAHLVTGERGPVLLLREAVTAAVARYESVPPAPKENYFAADGSYAAWIERCNTAIADWIRDAVVRDAAMIARRAAVARAALGEDASSIEQAIDRGSSDLALVDRGAALAARVAFAPGPRSSRFVHRLAAAARLRLKDRPPPGAHWARASMCGLDTVEDMEDDTTSIFGCGMGHLPEKARRFLYFYSQTPQQRWNARATRERKEAG